MRVLAIVLLLASFASPTYADGVKDNIAEDVRQVPPPGIEVGEEARRDLADGLAQLGEYIARLKSSDDAQVRDLLADVEIFHRAVRVALEDNQFFAPGDVEAAQQLLSVGSDRAVALLRGEAPWTTQTGLVVRGYVSRIDHTVQPYGLVIPAGYSSTANNGCRLDLWLHGRGETLSENNFIHQRLHHRGEIAPPDTIVLHPYGRYCNAFKFAGEIDILEALEHAKRHYRIDADRVAVRGFSMGGAGCWQMAVHYPDQFFAANPGAGFADTPEFLKTFQQETLSPTWYEEKLWRWYDCPYYAVNLVNLPTVAYSGELDIQKQAADLMEVALAKENITLKHVIGPQTKHSIHPDSGQEIERRLASLARVGRDALPKSVRFATNTLRYPGSHWVRIDGLEKHWDTARIEADMLPNNTINVRISNVTGFTLTMPAGHCPFPVTETPTVEVNGKKFSAPRPFSDRSWTFHYWNGAAQTVAGPPEEGLHKRAGLQGPIDDAFLDYFIVVRPTGTAAHEAIDKWVASECDHFLREWRRQFRGDAIVKNDTEVTDEEIASANLILFGDANSNAVLGKIADRLPIAWNSTEITAGEKKFDSRTNALVMIHPNPLNPRRYVVLNSGFTFREYAYLNNARQVAKLPDWAVIDIATPANSLWPGKVIDADFFDEAWQLK